MSQFINVFNFYAFRAAEAIHFPVRNYISFGLKWNILDASKFIKQEKTVCTFLVSFWPYIMLWLTFEMFFSGIRRGKNVIKCFSVF